MRALFVLSILFLFPSFNAYAGALVSNEARFEVANEYVEAKAGKFAYISLGSPGIGSLYQVQAQVLNEVYNDINIYICSKMDLQMFIDGRQNNCRGKNRKRGNMRFNIEAKSPEKHYLVVDNGFSIGKPLVL